MKRKTVHWIVAGLALLLLLGGITGCRRNEGPAGALPKGEGNSAATSGRQVFVTQGCVNCHSIGGQGGHNAPDLTHEGAKPGRSIDWLIAKVKNPHARSPGSRMPAFQDRISDRDLMALGGYLSSLK